MKIVTGKINDLSKDYRGWFIGSFIDKESPFNTNDFEVKWVERKKGESKENINPPVDEQKTLSILISGKFKIEFLDTKETKLFEIPGEYIYYQPTVPHKVTALEDTVMIVIRWPSI